MSTIKRAVAYEQTVRITLPVVLTGKEGDFDTLDRDDVEEAVIEYVRARLPERMRATAEITGSILGQRYFVPEQLDPATRQDWEKGPTEGAVTLPVKRLMGTEPTGLVSAVLKADVR